MGIMDSVLAGKKMAAETASIRTQAVSDLFAELAISQAKIGLPSRYWDAGINVMIELSRNGAFIQTNFYEGKWHSMAHGMATGYVSLPRGGLTTEELLCWLGQKFGTIVERRNR